MNSNESEIVPTAEELFQHETEHDLIDLDEHIEDIAKKVTKEKVDEIPHFLGGGGGGTGTGGLDTATGDARYLKLDQTTPQEVDNGAPTFNKGIVIKAGEKLYLDG
jgi:hypothetical protein